ncbi:sulfurtransferase [Seonamhaeicola sp.]|uniref:sulfurtransferase n=1 Tax=Seonamhaeicola sp. TaxID=1912245 RepID=UPI0026251E9E|nr:sulfurtransferase [Seonamhaeicola sp.]
MAQVSLDKPIVSVDWLHKNLEAENLVVLDGTISKSFDAGLQQIPNARFFDIKNKFSDTSGAFPNTFPSVAQFQSEARDLGINNDSYIVVYDDKGLYSSARVWWLFKAFGYDNVAVLDGGFPEWLQAGYPTEPMTAYQGDKGNFKADIQQEYMRFYEDLKEASKAKTHAIVDARSGERFHGKVPEPRAGLRSGNIPNSVNLPYTELLENGLLKHEGDLQVIFSNTLTTKSDPVIFSCGSGITACILALGAEISGYNNIAVYDGSWTEWGTLDPGTMEDPDEWTKDQLLAYILIYVSNSDLKESWKEREYILSRVDKKVYQQMHDRFDADSDYQSIQNIIKAVRAHDYYRNDFADLFADIKLMAFADGSLHQMEQMVYSQLRKILIDG